MSQTNWEADKMLDVYIHDYLVKRDLKASAQAFKAEAKVSSDPVAIDAPGGFLFEWWSVFWDIFIARTNEKHSEVATSYIETQLIKAREQQQPQQSQPQQQQLQMQQLLLQRHAQQQQQQQQQRREVLVPHHLNGLTNGLVGTDSLLRQNPGTVMAAKMYEDKLKMPQRSPLEDTEIKRFRENAGQFMDPTETSMMKSAGPSSQPSEQVLHGDAGCMSPQVQARGQQQPGPPPDFKTNLNPGLNPRAVGPEGSLIGIPGANQDGNNLTLKGWPLTGLDQLRSGLIQQQKPFNNAPQPFQNFQMLTPQHQQQLLLAQQNLTSSSANDLESRRLRMLLNSRNMSLGKDPLLNSAGDIIPNMGSSMQVNCVGLSRGDPDMLFKLKMAQMQQQNNQLQQHSLLNQMPQNLNHNLHQQDKLGGPGAVDVAMSNSYCGNDQTLKSQTGRKRKQVSSSGPANSTGTANNIAPSHGEAPSTPSNHTPPGGDMMSMPAMPHISNSSKPLMMFNTNGSGSLASPSNQLQWDKDLESQAEMDHFIEDGVLDNVESFLRHDDIDPGDTVGKVNMGVELD